jgi:hypothetical protein
MSVKLTVKCFESSSVPEVEVAVVVIVGETWLSAGSRRDDAITIGFGLAVSVLAAVDGTSAPVEAAQVVVDDDGVARADVL